MFDRRITRISIVLLLLILAALGAGLWGVQAQSAGTSFEESMTDGDVRWYEVNTPSAGLLSVNVKSDHSNVIAVYLYDRKGDPISNSSCNYVGHVSLDQALASPGVYKIMVSMGGISYGRTVSQIEVSSNIAMTRIPMSTNPDSQMEPGDANWYDLAVTSASVVSVNAVSDHSNIITISIYDGMGQKMAETASTYTGHHTLTDTIDTPGNYKYKVTLGNIPYGTTVSNVSTYNFVMPVAGTAAAITPSQQAPTAGPTATTQPGTSGQTPGGTISPPGSGNENSLNPYLIYILPLGALLGLAGVSSAGYMVLKRRRHSKGQAGQATEFLTPVSEMPAGGHSTDSGTIDVFISYSSMDKNAADAICHGLESAKIRCWIAPRDVVVGKSFEESIIDAINRSRVLVLVFSSHANQSQHIESEVRSAWKRGIPIVPFRLEDVAFNNVMDYYIGSKHWLDGMTPPLEKHIDELAEKIAGLLK